jgi:hypothetical protein
MFASFVEVVVGSSNKQHKGRRSCSLRKKKKKQGEEEGREKGKGKKGKKKKEGGDGGSVELSDAIAMSFKLTRASPQTCQVQQVRRFTSSGGGLG